MKQLCWNVSRAAVFLRNTTTFLVDNRIKQKSKGQWEELTVHLGDYASVLCFYGMLPFSISHIPHIHVIIPSLVQRWSFDRTSVSQASCMMTSWNGNIFRVTVPLCGNSPVNSPHKGQWHRALMFSLICAWINAWVNNREAGVLRRHRVHYDVIVMKS